MELRQSTDYQSIQNSISLDRKYLDNAVRNLVTSLQFRHSNAPGDTYPLPDMRSCLYAGNVLAILADLKLLCMTIEYFTELNPEEVSQN
jgi:hypothetical protein